MASQPNPTIGQDAARTYAGHVQTRGPARVIIRKHGHDRDRLNQAAMELKRMCAQR